MGFQVWREDEADLYQTIPHAGTEWRSEGDPKRQDHQYIRGKTCKLMTLFRPATGELRAKAVNSCPNAVLHPWLMDELTAILKGCEPTSEIFSAGYRWQDWDIYIGAYHLDRFFPPLRLLLILDNLAGHRCPCSTRWCAEHGVCLLSTPAVGSWLDMAESVQRIILRRALEGYHIYGVEFLKDWLNGTVEGWNRHQTPFIWGGKRMARCDRAYARRCQLGGSGQPPSMPFRGVFAPSAACHSRLLTSQIIIGAESSLPQDFEEIRPFPFLKAIMDRRACSQFAWHGL